MKRASTIAFTGAEQGQGKHDGTFRYASNSLFDIIAIIFVSFSSLCFDVFSVVWCMEGRTM